MLKRTLNSAEKISFKNAYHQFKYHLVYDFDAEKVAVLQNVLIWDELLFADLKDCIAGGDLKARTFEKMSADDLAFISKNDVAFFDFLKSSTGCFYVDLPYVHHLCSVCTKKDTCMANIGSQLLLF